MSVYSFLVDNTQQQGKVDFLLLLSCLFFFSFPGLSWAKDSSSQNLRVGIFSFNPVVFLSKDNQATGIYVDIIEKIAQQQGWQIEYVPGSWNDGLERLKSGDIDLMSSIAYSKERDHYFDFSKESVLTVWGEVYIRPQSAVQDVLGLSNAKIAIMKGDISGQNFQKLADEFQLNCSYIELPSHGDVLQWVKDEKALAGVVPNVFGLSHGQEYELAKSSIVFNAFSVYFAAIDGENSDVLQVIDATLKQWKKDEHSPYYEILNFWFSGDRVRSQIPKWVLIVLAVVCVASLLFGLWVRVLKVQVAARTRDLRESGERYRGIFNSTTDAIFIHEAESGAILDVNESMLEMFGYSRAEAVQTSIEAISLGESPYSAREAAEFIGKAAQGEPQTFEWRSRRKDGSLFWAEVALKQFSIGDDSLISAVLRDISDRKKLAEQVRQSQKMESIGTLAGGIAHDFNNILSAILGYTDMALDDIPKDSGTYSDIQRVLEAGNRAKDLVKQILTFSRQAEQELQPLEVQLIVKEALKLLRSSIPTTIEIKQDIDPDCQAVLADPTQIHQIIMNLCTNAYHAMRETGGVLGLSLKPVQFTSEDTELKINLHPGHYLKLEISDTGCGISKENIERIFEPYFTTKDKGEGTGLGLATVHGIVRGFNGDITVYSEPGNGATFRIFLPVTEQTKPGIQEEEGAPLPMGSERILLVDDDEGLVQMHKKMLERLGYKVTGLADSQGALEIFQKAADEFDLIITDMTMPNITGEELAKQVLKIRPGMPVILCTGFSELINEEKAKAIGICSYVTKPVVKRDFANAVRKVLDTS